MTGHEEQREQLEEEVARSEEELREAVEDLKEAVARPFKLAERVSRNPMPWMMAGVLLGVWLGARHED